MVFEKVQIDKNNKASISNKITLGKLTLISGLQKIELQTEGLNEQNIVAHVQNIDIAEISKFSEKELELRERELELRERELSMGNNSDNTQSDYPISHSFPDLPWIHKQDFKQDIDIVLMDMHHKYFYDDYTAPIKIAYTVWESTELEQNFFNQLLKFDNLGVVSEGHKKMAIKQAI